MPPSAAGGQQTGAGHPSELPDVRPAAAPGSPATWPAVAPGSPAPWPANAAAAPAAGPAFPDSAVRTHAVNSRSPVFSARNSSPLWSAILRRFCTAISLSTTTSTVSPGPAASSALFVSTTGSGHCFPLSSNLISTLLLFDTYFTITVCPHRSVTSPTTPQGSPSAFNWPRAASASAGSMETSSPPEV